VKNFRDLLRFVLETFDRLSLIDKERYIERFSITIAVGAACVASSFCYWFLPPLVRVLVVPVFIGAAWWVGARWIAPLIMKRVVAPVNFISINSRSIRLRAGILVSIACLAYVFFYWTFPADQRFLIVPVIMCAGWVLSHLR